MPVTQLGIFSPTEGHAKFKTGVPPIVDITGAVGVKHKNTRDQRRLKLYEWTQNELSAWKQEAARGNRSKKVKTMISELSGEVESQQAEAMRDVVGRRNLQRANPKMAESMARGPKGHREMGQSTSSLMQIVNYEKDKAAKEGARAAFANLSAKRRARRT